jgi:hypothetical protein
MSRIELTHNALRHGQRVLVSGVWHRVEWGLDNRLYLMRLSDNVSVAVASGHNELRAKIERLEREVAA